MKFLTIEEYLKNRGITILKNKEKVIAKQLNEGEVYFQLNLINKIHKILRQYPSNFIPSIQSTIGEDYEQIKVLQKRVNRYLEVGYFPGKIEEKVENILNLSNLAVTQIEKSEYLSIFRRAMDNKEITLGYCDDKNLNYNKGIIIYDLKGIAYNFVESDYGKFLLKIKRRIKIINYNEAIEFILTQEGLDDNSKKYLNGYISFPLETLKTLQKYKEGKKQWNEETFYYKFMKAYEFDNSITLL